MTQSFRWFRSAWKLSGVSRKRMRRNAQDSPAAYRTSRARCFDRRRRLSPYRLYAKDAVILHVAFGAPDEASPGLMQRAQPSKIDIAAIHHLNGSSFRHDQVQRRRIAIDPSSNRHQAKSTPAHCLAKLIAAMLLAHRTAMITDGYPRRDGPGATIVD